MLTKNISGLTKVSQILVKRRTELEEILRVAPLALNNLGLTYNPQAGTLDTRANLGEILNQIPNDPALLLCTMVNEVDTSGAACDLIRPDPIPGPATFGGSTLQRPTTRRFGGLHGGGPMKRCVPWHSSPRRRHAAVRLRLLVTNMPLPGGADVGDDPIVVHALFPDVLDLVPQSTVKLNDVTIGKVTGVELENYQADVDMTLRKDVDLPDNIEAEIRQTSLLGEKFVSLQVPEDPSDGRLGDGDVIGLDRTNRNPEVEEVLGALSLLLNGGGVAQLKTIATSSTWRSRAARATPGRCSPRSSPSWASSTPTRPTSSRAIDSLNRLAVRANNQRGTIESALDELPSALESIDKQRADLVKMLAGAQSARQCRHPGDRGLEGRDDRRR